MNPNDLPAEVNRPGEAADLLSPLLKSAAHAQAAANSPAMALTARAPTEGVVIGELVAIIEESKTPLVRFAGVTDSAAVRAQSTVDLHGAHIGARVVLMFEQADPSRPIVLGLLRGNAGWPMGETPVQVEVDTDGHRMVISANEQLVLRCGNASITLTKTGKVLIEGSYLLSRSTGVNRIKGGSVELN